MQTPFDWQYKQAQGAGATALLVAEETGHAAAVYTDVMNATSPPKTTGRAGAGTTVRNHGSRGEASEELTVPREVLRFLHFRDDKPPVH